MPQVQLAQCLGDYQILLERLSPITESPVTPALLIEVLAARDRVEAARTDPEQSITSEQLLQLSALDQQLQQQAEALSRVTDFSKLRSSVSSAEAAWWWHLDQLNFPYLSAQLTWLWKGFSILTWTANLGLLLNIAGRFLAGGPGVGGAAAIALPSILALLQAKNGLTDSGLEGVKQLLTKLGVPKRAQEPVQFISTLGLLVFLLGFWSLLPVLLTLMLSKLQLKHTAFIQNGSLLLLTKNSLQKLVTATTKSHYTGVLRFHAQPSYWRTLFSNEWTVIFAESCSHF